MEVIVILLMAMYWIFGIGECIDYFVCMVQFNVLVSQVELQVKDLLKKCYYIYLEDLRGVGFFNLENEFLSIINLFGGIQAFFWFVGIGILLVGIVGVGNIMFIIVKECIKEIGVCKVLGVLLLSIVWMVLVELVFIIVILGYLGFIVGIFLIWGVSLLM